TLCLFTLLTSTSAFARTESCDSAWKSLTRSKEIKSKYKKLIGSCDQSAKNVLSSIIRQRRSLNYREARVKMFGRIDNHSGKVCSVYSEECIKTRSIPNHRVMNAEHTWPKSKGAGKKPAVSDLHHIFPANSEVNSIRSSYPFCEVSKTQWTNNMSSLGNAPRLGTCFEPPVEHRGEVARAMFYFAVRYGEEISPAEEKWLRKWHNDDPVDQNEIDRNSEILNIQGNSNPFIDQPGLVEVIEDF
ncbi:endonuclease I family protein, partial [Halobacteriovorax sp.]|uniref:endonuclease I family protein n=1 Tax=Halobacteriovorax sp. TaxID=2020862 RepID=UPI00356993C4